MGLLLLLLRFRSDDHDLISRTTPGREQIFPHGAVDARGHLLPDMYTKTGHVENHFSVGPAILWAPVLVTVHLAVVFLARSFRREHRCRWILASLFAGLSLTTSFYGFSALFLAFKLARKYFEPEWAFLATIGIGWPALCRFTCISTPLGATHFPHFRFPSFLCIGIAPSCRDARAMGGFGSVRRP